jgi:hypothetical protein
MQYSAGSVSRTLNSTVLMPPRTRNVSPFRTGRYASRKYGYQNIRNRLPRLQWTFYLEIYIKDVATQTLDRIIEGNDMNTFAILNVTARVKVANISELDTNVVSCDCQQVQWNDQGDLKLYQPLLMRILPSSTASSLITMRTKMSARLDSLDLSSTRKYRTSITSFLSTIGD